MRQGLEIAVEQVMPEALATGLFVSRCTIQAPTNALDVAGQPNLASGFANVSGMVGIRCLAPPSSFSDMMHADEPKLPAQVSAVNRLHILLEGYYPAILERYRAVVDGVAYDILGVDSDSQGQMTRLEVQVVSL